ncbi:MAG TPA: hypothetical protein VGM93_13920 [Acidimicrobiales bacterium]
MTSLLDNVRPWLEPDEPPLYVFTGQIGLRPSWRWLSFWLILANKPRIVAITDRRMVVFRAGQLRTARNSPRELLHSLPRARLEHGSGSWSKVRVGREEIWLGRVAYPLMDKANAQLGPAATTAPAD